MDIISDITQAILAVLEPVSHMPYSTVFVVVVSVAIGAISTIATIRLTDVEQLRADMEVVKAWQAKMKLARKTMNPVLLQEVMDSQSRIMTIQARMMQARMKPMCVFYIPFIIIFGILNMLYGGTPVAILPFNIQKVLPFLNGWIGVEMPSGGFGLFFWSWYVLASMSLGGLMRRFANLGM
ncbi:MAG: EMC3/TMCO1 family protein [Candidatus Thorarchaeota archaeon]